MSTVARRGRALRLPFAVLAGVVAVVVVSGVLSVGSPDRPPPPPPIPAVHALGTDRQTIYSPPQAGGYTAWVGGWTMPDDSLMIGFVQATGPVDPAARQLAPERVVRAFGGFRPAPDRDFWGLHLAVKYLRSRDGGETWRPDRSDAFQAIRPHAETAQATMALRDGTLLRRVNGDDMRDDPSIPHTAFLQRSRGDGWGPPQVIMDPGRFTYQITRVSRLRDGRLIATGNFWRVPASTLPRDRVSVATQFLLMVSADEGRTWRNGLTIPESVGFLPGIEWSTAELPGGDLLAMMRTEDAPETRREVRKQATLVKRGDGWVMSDVTGAPFPASGHPELLTTREGPILDVATSGIHYTRDGRTWNRLRFSPPKDYRSNYYPRAVQARDGTVYVFGHVGSDDAYGATAQSITMDRFRLERGP